MALISTVQLKVAMIPVAGINSNKLLNGYSCKTLEKSVHML